MFNKTLVAKRCWRWVLVLVTLAAAQLTLAEVVRLEITARSRFDSPKGFAVGEYEEIRGVVHFAVDPNNSSNQRIADIGLAPRNAVGLVEFTADLVIWKPVDMARSNQVTLIDIPNRGGMVSPSFNKASATSPYGDGFLMNEGYTLVWVGWEYDSGGINIDVPSVPGVENSALSGLGLAAVRDVGSWLAHSSDAPYRSQHLLAFGLSQSGRFLRTFLYEGFNADEQGRQVFAGMIPHIAGASRLDVNRRGAQPTDRAMYTATAYPFADAAYVDPVSGAQEGLLDNLRAQATQPKIFYTNSGSEYWGGGRVAALTHLLPDGSQDIPLPDNVRMYYLASTQHGPASFPKAPESGGELAANPLDYWWHLRALLTAMTAWVVDGVQPPINQYPTLAAKNLVPLADVKLPAVLKASAVQQLTAGKRSANPYLPQQAGAGAALPFWLPQVDADGNEIAGLRHPELSVPLATYTGWNLQKGIQPPQLVPLIGGYLPFASSSEARNKVQDARLAISERYSSKQDFLNKVLQAAQQQVQQRYLLATDVDAIVARAAEHWDLLAKE